MKTVRLRTLLNLKDNVSKLYPLGERVMKPFERGKLLLIHDLVRVQKVGETPPRNLGVGGTGGTGDSLTRVRGGTLKVPLSSGRHARVRVNLSS